MYCDKQALIARFGEQELIDLTDRNHMGEINAEVLNQAIFDACAKMDGYLGGRYPLPLVSVPQVLIPLACDLTRFQLYDESPTDTVTKRYDSAIKFLESVNQGKVSLGISIEGDSPQSSDLADIQSAGSVFSRPNSGSFI